MLAWVVFAAAWIGHEILEQRAIRASVQRVASGEGKPGELVPYDFEAALYLVQELNQDESWDEGVRLARAAEKLLKGRIRASRRKGALVRVTFFQRRALTAALASWPEETAAKVRLCLEGEQPGDIPLEAEEREALEDLARSWRAEPARRASSTILRALLEGVPLEEVKPGASEIDLFWTIISTWRLREGARSTAAEKLTKVIGRPRKGVLELSPAAGRRLARLAAEWESKSYSKRRAERLEEILSGKPLEEVKLPADDEARLRASAHSWKRSPPASDEREAGEAILEAFGGLRFGGVVFDGGEVGRLTELARKKLDAHRERRHKLLSALAPVLENVTYVEQHHMFDIVNLLADADDESRRLGYRAVEALGEFVEKDLRERPGPSSERRRRRFLHLLTSSAEKRAPNPYLIIETSDATKRERADLLNALNLHKRKLVTELLGRFATPRELRSLSRLLSDPDIGDDMEEVFRARGLLSPGEPVGQDEAEREGREGPG